MNKLNLFSNIAPTGGFVLSAIAATVSSIVVAPSASAVNLCFSGDFNALSSTSAVTCEDKVFSNFSIDSIFDTGDETFAIENNEIFGDLGSYIFDYETPSGIIAGTGTSGVISYNIDITDPLFQFEAVAIDSTIDALAGNMSITKDIFLVDGSSAGQTISLSSINGNSSAIFDFGGATSIQVTDTVVWGTPGGSGELLSFDNSFRQERVPEPLTVLGTTIALGFGTMFKKRRSKAS